MRVLLVGMSNMLFQIITGVLATMPESIVVGRVTDPANVVAKVSSTNADVVMIQAGAQQNLEDVRPLLYRFPALKVVTITGDSGGGFVHELLLSTQALPELSADTLQTALRGDTIRSRADG